MIARTSTSTTASTTSSTSTTAATTSAASTGDASAQGGTVAFTDTTYSVAPSTGSIALTIARTGSASVPISVHYQTLDGTAVAGTQYQAVAGQLEWAENDSTPKTISVPIINAAGSGANSFQVVLVDPSAQAGVGNPGTATVTISDAAAATTASSETTASPDMSAKLSSAAATSAATSAGVFKLTTSAFWVTNNDGQLNVIVQRTSSAKGAASVYLQTHHQTASSTLDYTGLNVPVKWASGDTQPKTVSIALHRTGVTSGTRTFAVQLHSPSAGAAIGNPGSATVTIDEVPPAAVGQIALAAAGYSVAQDGGALKVTVSRTHGSRGKVGVTYREIGRTAVANRDFTAASGTLSWADGDHSNKTLTIGISNTQPFAGTRSFLIALSNPTGGVALASPQTATATIKGGATAAIGSLQFSAGTFRVGQGDGKVDIAVHRAGGAAGAISVNYSTNSGGAVTGTDFTATVGILHWADGDASSKTFSVPISAAKPFTGTKSFSVSLTAPTAGATLGTPADATVTIAGSGTPPVGKLELSNSGYTVAQDVGTMNVSVNRAGGASGATTVHYATANGTATAGTDYTAASGTVQWADGDTATKQIPIRIGNTTQFAGTKTFTVSLSAPTGGASIGTPSTATTTIEGAGAPAVGALALTASSFTVAQNAGTMTVNVNRTNGSAGAISVQFATSNGSAVAGTDYTATSGTLQWADGDGASKSIVVPISNASPFTGSKSFSLTLTSPSSGATLSSPSSATVSITGSATTGGSTAPPGSVLWVYHNGVFSWPGDYSWNATINYKDTSGGPLSGPYDIAVNIIGQWGGFQPYAFPYQGTPLNVSPYKYLQYCTKPTQPNQVHGTGFDANNDVPDGTMIQVVAGPNTTKYGPVPTVGKWGCYKIPLADFGLTNPLILKFNITDGTGNVPNLFYVDEVGFTTQ